MRPPCRSVPFGAVPAVLLTLEIFRTVLDPALSRLVPPCHALIDDIPLKVCVYDVNYSTPRTLPHGGTPPYYCMLKLTTVARTFLSCQKKHTTFFFLHATWLRVPASYTVVVVFVRYTWPVLMICVRALHHMQPGCGVRRALCTVYRLTPRCSPENEMRVASLVRMETV